MGKKCMVEKQLLPGFMGIRSHTLVLYSEVKQEMFYFIH